MLEYLRSWVFCGKAQLANRHTSCMVGICMRCTGLLLTRACCPYADSEPSSQHPESRLLMACAMLGFGQAAVVTINEALEEVRYAEEELLEDSEE